MNMRLTLRPLTAAEFAPFGDVIEPRGKPDMIINQGLCGRFHDLARMDFAGGRAGISLFQAKARHLPYRLDLVERHPLGSQAFLPLDGADMIVVVAEDDGGRPGKLHAFHARAPQGINLLRNTWHGVLAPAGRDGLFAVIDRIGRGDNLQEFRFDDPPVVEAGEI